MTRIRWLEILGCTIVGILGLGFFVRDIMTAVWLVSSPSRNLDLTSLLVQHSWSFGLPLVAALCVLVGGYVHGVLRRGWGLVLLVLGSIGFVILAGLSIATAIAVNAAFSQQIPDYHSPGDYPFWASLLLAILTALVAVGTSLLASRRRLI